MKKEQLRQIQDMLRSAPGTLATKKIAAGFDGFVDSIVKVVNRKTENGVTEYFDTIKGFGDYISAKSGSGFSLESEELFQKLGGNMPIMANAMANMSAAVDCIGAFGLPAKHGAFTGMHPACTLYSFTNPGFTTAMEFTDGKIMLGQMTDLNHAGWDTIKQAVGLPVLKQIFTGAHLVCLVNWSELDRSNEIWQGLLAEVFMGCEQDKSRQFFVDLSDCSKRSAEAIGTALNHLSGFGKYGDVTLSLNRNEAGILHKMLAGIPAAEDLHTAGDQLFKRLEIDTLIIHTSKVSLAWNSGGSYSNQPVFIPNPVISTGAGDNFNAGFCIGRLLGLDAEQSLLLANSASNYYINSGESATLNKLDAHISELFSASL